MWKKLFPRDLYYLPIKNNQESNLICIAKIYKQKTRLVTKLVGGIIETRLELALFLNFLVNQLTI